MEKRIVWVDAEGLVHVTHPAPKHRGFALVSPAVMEERETSPAITEERPSADGETMERVEIVPALRELVEVTPAEWRPETDTEFCQRLIDGGHDVPAEAREVAIVDAADIPADRTFRNAWRGARDAAEPVALGCVHVCMAAARNLHRDAIRAVRATKMAALDVAYMRALERGLSGEMTRITARKQALRDAPADPAIEAAKTPEELKAVWPAALVD